MSAVKARLTKSREQLDGGAVEWAEFQKWQTGKHLDDLALQLQYLLLKHVQFLMRKALLSQEEGA